MKVVASFSIVLFFKESEDNLNLILFNISIALSACSWVLMHWTKSTKDGFNWWKKDKFVALSAFLPVTSAVLLQAIVGITSISLSNQNWRRLDSICEPAPIDVTSLIWDKVIPWFKGEDTLTFVISDRIACQYINYQLFIARHINYCFPFWIWLYRIDNGLTPWRSLHKLR